MLLGIYMLTAWTMSAPIVITRPWDTPNISASKTSVLFADASAIHPTIVQTNTVPSVMTLDTLLLTVPSWRTPAAGLFSTMETPRGSEVVPVVQVFKGGIVMVQGQDLIFSIIHWSPLTSDSPLTFTVSTTYVLYRHLPICYMVNLFFLFTHCLSPFLLTLNTLLLR